MKVLVACEESQVVATAFRLLGHEAFSCDLQDCSGGHPEWHLKGDIRNYFFQDWDMMIAHPPCTYLCNSGVRWLKGNPQRFEKMLEAAQFFKMLWGLSERIPRVCIENPVPHKHAKLPKYNQIVQPWYFGDGEKKATCLWLHNLPPLHWSGEYTLFDKKTTSDERGETIWRMAPGPERAKLRSKTFPGIAEAMAEQWGKLNREQKVA